MTTSQRHRIGRGRGAGGWSAIGMLVTLVCILVLSVILLNALSGAVGGPGVPGRNTVRSMEDQLNLYAMTQAMITTRSGLMPDSSARSSSSE